MAQSIQQRILDHLGSDEGRPLKARGLAHLLNLHDDASYPQFRLALNELIKANKVMYGPRRVLMLTTDKPVPPASPATPSLNADATPQKLPAGIVIGTFRQNKRGFGFIVPSQPDGHDDVFIGEYDQRGAITGDIVRARVTGSHRKQGKVLYDGKILEIIQRTQTRFVGSLVKRHGQWVVLPDGNVYREPIETPDAGSRHIKPDTKVVVELTRYAQDGEAAQGVITEVLGQAGEKDVDLRTVIVQYDLPGDFSDACRDQARLALDRFNASLNKEIASRLDLTRENICTIDPDDAKDYDDAISLTRTDTGNWVLGVHIADVSFFVEPESPLDLEAASRGNSIYFPGHVIPMLPEVLSNGVCSLQEGVERLTKSAFIELDRETGKPVRTWFDNSVIKSAKRLRYREAQAILDNETIIPHPDGNRTINDYPADVIQLLRDMDTLSRLIQKRRIKAGQITLDLPEVDLVLDEEGKVIGAVPEDESYTHTLIEMFMVEANEAVARLLNSLQLPFLRRAHDEPAPDAQDRMRAFLDVAGYKLPRDTDRHALQALLAAVKDRPEAFAINLAVLKSLARAEYSPESIGHYALASEHYAHFTSPIRRYADLTIHRLLDAYFVARRRVPKRAKEKNVSVDAEQVPSFNELVALGKHLGITERRADEAEKELRTVKILELLQKRVGETFKGVVTSVTKFGVFIQLAEYLIDGLVRYEELLGDWWEVDERAGVAYGRQSQRRIKVGDIVKATVARVDVPRRELDLGLLELPKGQDPRPKVNAEGDNRKPKPRAGTSKHKAMTVRKKSTKTRQPGRRK